MGALALWGEIDLYSFLNILSLGSLAMVPVWIHLIKRGRPKIENNWPYLAKMIYAGEESPYLAGFIILLVPATLFRIVNLEFVAEQFAVLGFYMLIMGIFLKVKELSSSSE